MYTHYLGLKPKTDDHWQSPQNWMYIALAAMCLWLASKVMQAVIFKIAVTDITKT